MRHLLVPALACACALPLTAAETTESGLEAPTMPSSSTTDGENALKWGGYGEMHYTDYAGDGKSNKLDFHRFVLMAEYQLEDNIRFVSEFEIEHAFFSSTSGNGELEIEQAYIDFSIDEDMSVQAGMMLLPISWTNVHHEPTQFHGVERPYVEKVIVPTTWFENGIQFSHTVDEKFSYKIGAFAALDKANITPGSAKPLRNGRQKGSESTADNFLFVGHAEYQAMDDLVLTASLLTGSNGTNSDAVDTKDYNLTLITLDARYRHQQIEGSLSYSNGTLDDAGETSDTDNFYGINATVAYDIMPHISDISDNELWFFARFEQWKVTDADSANNGDIRQIGATWKPSTKVSVKFDYQDWDNDTDSATDRWNLGLGYAF